MATYKVIQDIEAEDKLLGPLSLRQFIYAVIVVVCGFISFRLILASLWFLVLPFLPVMVFFAVLAAPFGHDQSSEVWLLAKVRFFLKPRKRIWNQDGVQELVTITAPKKIERSLTKDLSQTEVKSRLQALANTIDSRGWAVKNVNVNLFSEPSYVLADTDNDRLINPTNLPQDVPAYDVQAADDIFDERVSPTAQHLTQLMAASSQTLKQQAVSQVQAPATNQSGQKADYWFLHGESESQQPTAPKGYATFGQSKVVSPDPADDDQAFKQKLRDKKAASSPAYGNMRTIQPLSSKKQTTNLDDSQAQAPMTATPHPAIIELANNDDLNVATIARQAHKATGKQPPDDEVVISLR